MSNEQNRDLMEDSEDTGLKAVMGGKFKDLSSEQKHSAPKVHKKAEADPALIRQPSRAATFPRGEGTEAAGASLVKLNTISPMARLKACAKGVGLYGGISLLLFWWQQTGMLASKAAVPSFIVLALLAGLKIGRVCHE